jgi:hypothetical protein
LSLEAARITILITRRNCWQNHLGITIQRNKSWILTSSRALTGPSFEYQSFIFQITTIEVLVRRTLLIQGVITFYLPTRQSVLVKLYPLSKAVCCTLLTNWKLVSMICWKLKKLDTLSTIFDQIINQLPKITLIVVLK